MSQAFTSRMSRFSRATLPENCLFLGTDNVRGRIVEHIFAPNGSYCLYIHSKGMEMEFEPVVRPLDSMTVFGFIQV